MDLQCSMTGCKMLHVPRCEVGGWRVTVLRSWGFLNIRTTFNFDKVKSSTIFNSIGLCMGFFCNACSHAAKYLPHNEKQTIIRGLPEIPASRALFVRFTRHTDVLALLRPYRWLGESDEPFNHTKGCAQKMRVALYIVLYCIILCNIIFYLVVLYCVILYYSTLHSIM